MDIVDGDGDVISVEPLLGGINDPTPKMVEIVIDQKTSGGYGTVILTKEQSIKLGKYLLELWV